MRAPFAPHMSFGSRATQAKPEGASILFRAQDMKLAGTCLFCALSGEFLPEIFAGSRGFPAPISDSAEETSRGREGFESEWLYAASKSLRPAVRMQGKNLTGPPRRSFAAGLERAETVGD